MSADVGKQTTPAEPNLKLQEILERTGYSHEVTAGQRKYGGPPPNWEGPPPGQGHEVFCGKIPKDVLEDELIPLFEACGTIWDLRLMMDPATKQCRSFAFVTFTDKSTVDAAVKQLDGYQIRPGKKLKVNPSTPNCRLFVGNIPKSKSKEDIVQEFTKVVEGLQDVIIYNVPDDPKKKNRGFTFLDFDSHKSAAAAKKRLSTCRVFGCDIIIDWADPLEEPDEETMSKVKVLYVRNLKSDVSEAMLRTAFEVHGTIEKVKKVKDYGFIHFTDRDGALHALEALNGAKIGESEMQISLAKPPTDAKVKEKRKLHHMMLLGRGPYNQFWGGPAMPNRGLPRGRMRGPSLARGMAPRYMDYYQGGGMYEQYGAPYGPMDDYYVNYSGGGFDDYYGYEDYDYYSQGPFGARGRGRGNFLNRGRSGMPYEGSSYGMLARGGGGAVPGRGQRFFGTGATAARGGPKRKPAISASDMAGGAGLQGGGDIKKLSATVDTWSSPPIPQQPLGQTTMDGYGDGDWYQDSYTTGALNLQRW